jgi:hypothetical protein
MVRERIMAALGQWFPSDGANDRLPEALEHESLDLSVAKGAAYYSWVRRGHGTRVGAGIPRSYYIKVGETSTGAHEREDTFPAVCVIERNMEEGDDVTLDRDFEAVANKPVQFDMYSSTMRMNDRVGEILTLTEDSLHKLPPVRTVLRFGKKSGVTTIPVQVKAQLTEVGTLALWCASKTTPHRWQLHFDLRRDQEAAERDTDDVIMEEEILEPAIQRLTGVFQPPVQADDRPKQLVKDLQKILDMSKDTWPLSAARRMAEALLAAETRRDLGPDYEARWLNLIGWLLRPGFGHPMDEWKIKQVWKIFPQGLYFDKDVQCCAEWWILWRRIAGGLEAGHQLNVFERIRPYILGQKQRGKSKGRAGPQELTEMWRTAASLERLPVDVKVALGDTLVGRIKGKKIDRVDLWCLRRLGARVPFYGPLDRVAPREAVSRWIDKLLCLEYKDPEPVGRVIAHLARRCEDRERDVNEATRAQILEWLAPFPWQDRCRELVQQHTALGESEQQETFGESLPAGLIIDLSAPAR